MDHFPAISNSDIALIPLIDTDYGPKSGVGGVVSYFFSGNSRESFLGSIDSLCYFLRGQGVAVKRSGVSYGYWKEKKGFLGFKHRELILYREIEDLKVLQGYCEEGVRISIIPDSTGCTSTGCTCKLDYCVEEAYSMRRYKARHQLLTERFSGYGALYNELFDEACLDKRYWKIPQHFYGFDQYTIHFYIDNTSVKGLYVISGHVPVDEYGPAYPSNYSIAYSTPSESFIKPFREYGMKNLETLDDFIGFSEAFTAFIISRIEAEEIEARVEFNLSKDPVHVSVLIFVDEKPRPFKHAKDSDLASW